MYTIITKYSIKWQRKSRLLCTKHHHLVALYDVSCTGEFSLAKVWKNLWWFDRVWTNDYYPCDGGSVGCDMAVVSEKVKYVARMWCDQCMMMTKLLLGGGQGSSKHQNVGFWIMLHVVNPSLALLHTETSPFRLRHQFTGNQFCNFFWKHHMSIFVLVISVFVWVINVLVGHLYSNKKYI